MRPFNIRNIVVVGKNEELFKKTEEFFKNQYNIVCLDEKATYQEINRYNPVYVVYFAEGTSDTVIYSSNNNLPIITRIAPKSEYLNLPSDERITNTLGSTIIFVSKKQKTVEKKTKATTTKATKKEPKN